MNIHYTKIRLIKILLEKIVRENHNEEKIVHYFFEYTTKIVSLISLSLQSNGIKLWSKKKEYNDYLLPYDNIT